MVEVRSCPFCGRVIPLDAIICPYCGKKFVEIEPIVYNQIKEEKKHNGFGIASLVLGIIGMCFIWTTFFGPPSFAIWLIFLRPMGILSIVFGAIGRVKIKPHDTYGLIGLILGILLIVLGLIFTIISIILLYRPYYYY